MFECAIGPPGQLIDLPDPEFTLRVDEDPFGPFRIVVQQRGCRAMRFLKLAPCRRQAAAGNIVLPHCLKDTRTPFQTFVRQIVEIALIAIIVHRSIVDDHKGIQATDAVQTFPQIGQHEFDDPFCFGALPLGFPLRL